MRTGESGKNSDIIFCAPSNYMIANEKVQYEWIALPENEMAFCPANVIALLLGAANAKPVPKIVPVPLSLLPPPAPLPLVIPVLHAVVPKGKGKEYEIITPDIDKFDHIIFCDGGANPNPGPAASAIVRYNVRTRTAEVLTRFIAHSTNNATETLSMLGAVRWATLDSGNSLIIADSMLALCQALCKMDCRSPGLLPMVTETRSLLAQPLSDRISFAHMDGHGVVPNPADPQCTHAIGARQGLDHLKHLVFDLPEAATANDQTDKCWVAPAPTNVVVLGAHDLEKKWKLLKLDNVFALWWTSIDNPLRMHSWTGTKMSENAVRYATEDSEIQVLSWPPEDNVRVHRMDLLAKASKSAKGGRRIRPSCPATLCEIDIDDTVRMFRSFGPDTWVQWCMNTPVRRTLPSTHWHDWSSVVKRFLSQCMHAPDEALFVDASLIFLGLPQLYLDRRVKNNLCLSNLQRHAAFVCVPSATKSVIPKQDIADDEKAARLAQTLACQGFMSKACKALAPNKMLDATLPRVRSVLADKHPPAPETFNIDTMMYAYAPHFAGDIEYCLVRLANGSAPGWSGWSKELLLAACKADPSLYCDLGVFLARLQQVTDPRLSDIVRAGKLMALNNAKDGEEIDPRPITISELFTKLLGTLAIMKSAYDLHGCQRGVRHPGGTHQAIVEIQKAYDADLDPQSPEPPPPPPPADFNEAPPSRPPSPAPSLPRGGRKVVATFDVKNAFNATRRDAIFRKLSLMGASASYLLEFFKFMYGTESDIYIQAHKEVEKYRSATGVRQGDMPASLLFSLVFTDAAIGAAVASGLGPADGLLEKLWMYLDDVTVVETVPGIIAYKIQLEIYLEKIGLSLNMKKCRVLVDRCTEDEIKLLLAAGFQIDLGCTRVLGSPIGDPAACREWVIRKLHGWQSFWEKLRLPDLHPSTALTILKICGNVKFEHLAKSLAPEVVMEAARRFDATVEATALTILNIKHHQVDNYVVRAVLHLVPYAVITQCLYENTCNILVGIREPLNVAIRSTLVNFYEQLSLPPFVGQLIRSAQSYGASLAITPTLSVPAHEYAHGMRLRCGVAEPRLPQTCTCLHKFANEPVDRNGHMLTCSHNEGFNKTCRHHLINSGVGWTLATYHQWSTVEPAYLSSVLRPDRHIAGQRGSIIDVTCVDSVLARDPDYMERAAIVKHRTYDALAELHSIDFFPIVVDVYGEIHAETFRCVRQWSKALNPHLRKDFCREMLTNIQHALLRGNAKVADEVVNRLSHRNNSWW